MQGKKGTVLYIGGFELPDKNAAAHRVLNNAKIFGKLGYDVVFCGVEKSLGVADNTVREKVNGFINIPLRYSESGTKRAKQFFSVKHYKSLFYKFSDIKLVLVYNLHFFPLKKMISLCKKHNIKIVSDCTEWYDYKFSLNPISLIKKSDSSLCMKYLNKKLDGIIAVSEYLGNYYLPYIKNIVIPPLVDVNEEKWNITDSSESSEIEFVYSGDPGKKDKLDVIIEALYEIGQYSKYIFKIYGITKAQFLSKYPDLTDVIGRLDKNIIFFGRVSHKESIKALKTSDYCIFVRDKNRRNTAGFPTKFVESFTSGINIIANNISDIEKYFPEDGNSYLIDGSKESLISALKKALNKNVNVLRSERRDGLVNNPFHYELWKNKISDFFKDIGV